MRCWLYKLRFTTMVHFGGEDAASALYSSAQTFCADTLFSALCHTAHTLWGDEAVRRLCTQAQEGQFLLSDSMPWRGEEYYLPRPLMRAKNAPTQEAAGSRERKAMKALQWVPLSGLDEYLRSLNGGPRFDAEKHTAHFGTYGQQVGAKIQPGEDTLPYQIGRFCFDENCGLYFLAQCADEETAESLETLVTGLGLGGIGGRVSSGSGRFVLEQRLLLNNAEQTPLGRLAQRLEQTDAPQLLLTTSLPADEELDEVLEGAYYRLSRRGGFVQPAGYAPAARKKKTQYFLGAGSVVPCRYRGAVYEVGGVPAHPVYRYGRAMFLGVDP